MSDDVPKTAGKHRADATEQVLTAMQSLVLPAKGYLGCAEVLATALGLPGASLHELASLPLGPLGQRLMALRYLIANGAVWLEYYAWQKPLERQATDAPERVRELWRRIGIIRQELPAAATWRKELEEQSPGSLAEALESGLTDSAVSDQALRLLVGVHADEHSRAHLRGRLYADSSLILSGGPKTVDVLYLLSQDLAQLPATTVGEGKLDYIIVADKGEMGVRAVREAIAYGAVPVVMQSIQDDARALQVRLAEEAGGFAVPLRGSFRETYANPQQIAERLHEEYRTRFGDEAQDKLARSALYPGYGPLAENTAAIELFRRSGIVFIGPSQDVVDRAGDKRRFRLLAEEIDPAAVTPGIVMDATDPSEITAAIRLGLAQSKYQLPGRLKAANGGGGRGQRVILDESEIPAAVGKVLGDIAANGWDPGLMFEQNIFETTHLEVQVVRDRFGNTRHFGMRDCTEQRASQKIQEEAPPVILAEQPELEQRMCEIAVRIADRVGYVGACTVELMYKDGKFFLLEMNTRIQVEHPVTEEAHKIRRKGKLVPLNLVRLQFEVARGRRIDFAQEDVVRSHVAREFRINAESYRPDLKDARDGKKGLFLPNAGIFDVIELPDPDEVTRALADAGHEGIEDMVVRFDCGFEVGDDLVNKDPTFGKLIVAVACSEAQQARRYELLRLASIEVLSRLRIEGRQLTPQGKILQEHPFLTNIADHLKILRSDMLIAHSAGGAQGRHVNWVLEMLRAEVTEAAE